MCLFKILNKPGQSTLTKTQVNIENSAYDQYKHQHKDTQYPEYKFKSNHKYKKTADIYYRLYAQPIFHAKNTVSY